MSDDALCLAWRTSYVRLRRLQRAHQDHRVADLARQRGRYLDELERRHPEGSGAWIANGAGASTDPTPNGRSGSAMSTPTARA